MTLPPQDQYIDLIKNVYRKTFTYQGRASRGEFWYFFVYNALVVAILSILSWLDPTGFIALISMAYSFVHFFVWMSLTVRRLHDADHSGFWILISMVPLIGAIILFVFLATPGDPEANRYGPNPLRFEHAPGQEVI